MTATGEPETGGQSSSCGRVSVITISSGDLIVALSGRVALIRQGQVHHVGA